jgi:hypothetical protein
LCGAQCAESAAARIIRYEKVCCDAVQAFADGVAIYCHKVTNHVLHKQDSLHSTGGCPQHNIGRSERRGVGTDTLAYETLCLICRLSTHFQCYYFAYSTEQLPVLSNVIRAQPAKHTHTHQPARNEPTTPHFSIGSCSSCCRLATQHTAAPPLYQRLSTQSPAPAPLPPSLTRRPAPAAVALLLSLLPAKPPTTLLPPPLLPASRRPALAAAAPTLLALLCSSVLLTSLPLPLLPACWRSAPAAATRA